MATEFVRAPAKDSYDLIVLGSGPGGQRAAVQAAKLGKSVLVIEKQKIGGSCLHMGTIPSKTLRESALSAAPEANGLQIVMARTHRVIEEERQIIEEQLARNAIEFVGGVASFVDEHKVEIKNAAGTFEAKAQFIVIATGTRPRRPADIPFDGEVILDSDTLLGLKHQPQSLLVLGAGVIGCEYASIFARTGVKVTLVEGRAGILPSIDQELVQALMKQFEASGIAVRTATQFKDLHRDPGKREASITLIDEKGEAENRFEAVLYCLGRSGNFEELKLGTIGLKTDERGSIPVNKNYQTSVSNIYAVGDIIGAPALAASSSEQGRLAVLHALTSAKAEFPDTFPYGIYTIPEISSVGYMESQLAKRKIKYVVGKAQYRELARGKMIADEHGFLKLVVHARTRRVVGIHVIGTSATELVHIGQVAIAFGATVDFFLENVFNYPTLAEAYKVAAFNAVNQLGFAGPGS